MKINVTLQIELPDDAATVDGMEDINAATLVEKVRKDVEYFTFASVDSSEIRVSAIINGEIQAGEPTPVITSLVVETPSGVLAIGTRVVVTFREEPTVAEVIGYDNKYQLHKVRTHCGKVLLRKVQQAA